MTKRKFICRVCEEEAPRRSNGQRFCVPCASIKQKEARERGTIKFNLKHRDRLLERDRKYAKEKRLRNEPAIREKGLELNAKQDLKSYETVNLVKGIIVNIPFHRGVSKNYAHGISLKNGYVFLKKDARAVRDAIHYKIKSVLSGIIFKPGKVWVDIFVEKPDHRSDAINVVDTVCDAIKIAIGVDDRWFSIRRVDWAIIKTNPMITIVIGQEDDDEKGVCQICGRILLATMFTKRKQRCKDCRTASR